MPEAQKDSAIKDDRATLEDKIGMHNCEQSHGQCDAVMNAMRLASKQSLQACKSIENTGWQSSDGVERHVSKETMVSDERLACDNRQTAVTAQ